MAIQDTDLLVTYRESDQTHYKLSIDDIGNYIDSTYGSYLRTDAAAGDQTVESTGTTTFDSIIRTSGGVNVKGGGGTAASGPDDDSVFPLINGFVQSGGKRLKLEPLSADSTSSVELNLYPPQAAGKGGGALIVHNKTLNATQDNALRVTGDWTGDYTATGGSSTAFNAYILASGNIQGATTTFDKPITGVGSGCRVGSGDHWVGFRANGKAASDAAPESYIGFKSTVYTDNATTAYNVYAEGTAPNYFGGDTYIGGTTARNTFDLWKSTLTEEQLEQLEAGTLVVPANVSLPGDGEFARQWYYDQQDTDSQAELDAGTLNYPTHLAAATFTDTFKLGDNTNINLKAGGTIFANTLLLPYGAGFLTDTSNPKELFVQQKIVAEAGTAIGLKSVNNPTLANEISVNCPRLFFNRCQDPSGLQINENRKVINTNLEPCNEDSILGELNFSTSQGATDIYLARFTAYSRAAGGELELSNTNGEIRLTAWGNLQVQKGADTVTITPGGSVPSSSSGSINATAYRSVTAKSLDPGATISLAMQSDDPSTYTSTTTTDDEGVETTTTVYNGTTEDLLSIIKELRARVTALEAAA